MKLRFERSIDVDAPPARVWAILEDVERWHEWTASITRVTRTDPGAFGLGSRARVEQPLLAPADFEVTTFEPGVRFTWETTNQGVHAAAHHVISPTATGSRVTLAIDYRGWPLLLAAGWVWWITVRYFRMELEGLKGRSEAAG